MVQWDIMLDKGEFPMSDHTDTRPASQPVRNRWLVLATVSIGTFMSTLDGSIANVALPTIAGELDTPIHVVQWVLTAYLLTICATLPILGKLSDMLGRGRVFNTGFLIFAAGSALCGFSSSLTALIGSRILQAVGASCLMANSQAIIAETFTKNGRGRALGITGMMVSLGSLTGPGIGGILVGSMGWPSIFWINVPIGIVGFIAGLFLLPKPSQPAKRQPFDSLGSLLFVVGMVAFLFTLSNGESYGWRSTVIVAGGIGSVAVLAAFYFWERRIGHPMLDFRLYRIRAFAFGNLAAFLSFVALFFMNIMMPFYMQNALLFPADVTGYTMMMNPLMMAVVAPLSGWLSDKIGSTLLTTAGLAINALAFGLLNTLTLDATPVVIGLHLALFGIGSGLFQSPNNSSVMGAVPPPMLGSAGGLNALVRNIGMVVGTSLSVSLYSASLGRAGGEHPEAVVEALHLVFWTAMGICLFALLVSSLRIKRSPAQVGSGS